MTDAGFSIDMRKDGLKVQMIYLIGGLAFEINVPGMKMSRHVSTVRAAQSLGFTGSNKAKALRWAVQTATEGFGYEVTPNGPVAKALAKLDAEDAAKAEAAAERKAARKAAGK
jgi:hypothetical protein